MGRAGAGAAVSAYALDIQRAVTVLTQLFLCIFKVAVLAQLLVQAGRAHARFWCAHTRGGGLCVGTPPYCARTVVVLEVAFGIFRHINDSSVDCRGHFKPVLCACALKHCCACGRSLRERRHDSQGSSSHRVGIQPSLIF